MKPMKLGGFINVSCQTVIKTITCINETNETKKNQFHRNGKNQLFPKKPVKKVRFAMSRRKFEARQQQKAMKLQRNKQECHDLKEKIRIAENFGQMEDAWELRRKRNRLRK